MTHTLPSLLGFVCLSICQSMNTPSQRGFVQGTYHAWWVILPVPVASVEKMIANSNSLRDIELMKPTWEKWPNEFHPVLMEIGEEENCGLINPPLLRENFMEYKLDIPFVRPKTSLAPMNYKTILYVNNELESISSRLFYKLNTTTAVMDKTYNSFNISMKSDKLTAIFSSNSSWYKTLDIPEFNVYKDIANQKWFGGRGLETCAYHYYDFNSAQIRPATVKALIFSPSLLNDFFPALHFYVFPLSANTPFGSVQLTVNFTMSLPLAC